MPKKQNPFLNAVKNIFLLTAVTVIFILFLEAGIRLAWAVCLEMKYGYHTRQNSKNYFLFSPDELTDPFGESYLKWNAAEDIFNALTRKPPYGPVLSELFPELPWQPEKKILASSLNRIILDHDKQQKFIKAFADKYPWESSATVKNLAAKNLSEKETQRTVRMMMGEMYPVYGKFYFAHGGASRDPLEVLSYGSNAVMKVRAAAAKKLPSDPVDIIHLYAVGGSTTRCMGVSSAQCWTAHLEGMLERWREENKSVPRFKVVNLGISSGTSLDSKEAVFSEKERLREKFDLDYLLWYEGLNDVFYFIEGAKRQKDFVSKPGTLLEMKRSAAAPFGKKLAVYLYQHSALVFWVFQVKRYFTFRKDAAALKNPAVLRPVTEAEREPLVDEAARINYRHLTEIRPLVQKRVFMFSIPLPRESQEKHYHLDFESKQKMFSKLEAMAEKDKIPFGDIAGNLESQPVENVFTSDRVHLNAYGNFLLARQIFEFIKPYLEHDLKK